MGAKTGFINLAIRILEYNQDMTLTIRYKPLIYKGFHL